MKTTTQDSDTLIECAICLEEIPESAAKITETQDYIQHFCGLDCYQQWQNRIKAKQGQDQDQDQDQNQDQNQD